MASGSTTVLSNLPWVDELIANGRDALVVEPRADAVAAALERLLLDDSERQRLAAAGRKLVERYRNREAELARIEPATGTWCARRRTRLNLRNG